MTQLDILPTGFDFTDPDVNLAAVPLEEFAALRRSAPVFWVEQTDAARAGMSTEAGTGYWAITRHADIAAVSKNSKLFSSAENAVLVRYPETSTRESVEATRVVIINQDAPDHTLTRQIISRGFTPRAINALEEVLEERAKRIVAEAVAAGSGNFVEQVAALLPLEVIADMLGVPPEDRKKLFDWSNQMTVSDDPDFAGDPEAASIEMMMYAMGLAADRKANPREDIVTKLVHADKDGRGLTDDEFGFFVIALAVAGNETTRIAISQGMNAFFDHPDQWELWKTERPAAMVDEVVRWATPVIAFQRTALADVTIGDTEIAKGQRVLLFYASGNNDDEVFTDPERFDITRDPNPHLGFGGHGAHYCIGANLARMEIKLIFEALADLAPGITRTGDPVRVRSGWLNGLKELPVRYA